jgi:hypothetical protein
MGAMVWRAVACLAGSVALATGAAGAAWATTFSPNRFDDPTSGGTSCTPPAPPNACSLRGAVQAAQAGDSIHLAAGTYTLTSGKLQIVRAIALVGAGPGTTTILQRARDRVVQTGADVSLSGLTVSGGELFGTDGAQGTPASPLGGDGDAASGVGIDAAGHLTLTDVVVSHNIAIGGKGGDGAQPASTGAGGDGGPGGEAYAVGIDAGDVTFTRVVVVDNMAISGDGGSGAKAAGNGNGGDGGAGGDTFGAGMRVHNGSMRDVLIADNTVIAGNGGNGGAQAGTNQGGAGGDSGSPRGGGLYAQGSLGLTNVTVTGNMVQSGDGGDGGTGSVHGGPGGDSVGAVGGGIAEIFSGDVQLVSSTVAGNVTTGGAGGNGGAQISGTAADGASVPSTGGNIVVQSAHVEARDSIIAGGIADSAASRNCELIASGPGDQPLLSLGHNLEDGNDCIATPAAGDIQNTPAGLGPLADNGGPLPTMALLAGSHAIDAGQSGCVDAAGQPLAADARGFPRGMPCDIGAFEGQPPAQSSAPVIAGAPSRGVQLTCAGATFTGDAPLTITIQWLRDGTAIAGATTSHYTVSDADLGHALTCAVTAVNIYGSATATSSAVRPPAPAPVLTGLALKPKTAHNGKAERLSFTLNTSARVTFVLTRASRGTRAHGGPKGVNGNQGANKVRWVPHKLVPGRYTLTATPAGGRPAKPLKFSVKG